MDIEQINNILSTTDKEEVQFSDAQWLYLQDNNNGQYNNYLQYLTTTLKQQFIDYHNGFVYLPMSIEVANQAATGSSNIRPPLLALRQSVLSLFSQQMVTTDQGQTIVNDNNTQMINNLRLEIEHNLPWVWSEGSELDYAYDCFTMLPAQDITTNAGPTTGVQSGYSFRAPQGIELGAINASPLTNDPNEFGGDTLTTFPFTATSSGVTAIGDQPSVLVGETRIRFSDGRYAYFPVTYTAAGTGTLTSIGGIALANYATLPNGFYSGQALGSTSVLANPIVGQLVTIPIIITVASGVATFTNVGTIQVAVGSFTNAVAYSQMGGRNPNFNKGFLERITIFQNTSSYVYTPTGPSPNGNQTNSFGIHTFYYVATIPLKLLHDFWQQLNFPIINVGFQLTFNLNQSHGITTQGFFPPFQTSWNQGRIAGGTDISPRPAIYYGKSEASSGSRLYYRTVKFSPADNARMAEKLTTGFTKSVKFICTDWIQQNNLIDPNSGTMQYQIANSVVHPLRLWVLPYAVNNNLTTTTDPVTGTAITVAGSFLQDDTYAPGVITGYYNQTNVLVNNVPYYRQNMQNYQDLWEQLAEQFNPDTGSMIRYVDWRNYKRYHCYDLTRLSERLQSPTEPVSLIFQGSRADGLPYRLQNYYLIERLNQVTFRFSSSDVAIVVGNLD